MMRRLDGGLLGVSLLALSCVAGCGSDACEDASPVKLATFNAGLAAVDVEYVPERVQPVVDALAAQSFDVLCVQEFFDQAHWAKLVQATEGTLPNSVRRPPLSTCPSGCVGGETGPVVECAAEHCADSTGETYLECAYEHCTGNVNALSTSCLTCVMLEAQADPSATPADLDERCEIPADQAGDAYLFDCTYDTGLLTKASIVDQESRPLDSFVVVSTVDYARIDTSSGELDVYCAHLQSEMGFPYAGDFGSYEQEQAHQIDQLLAFIAENDDGSRPVVLMGDLNTGPDLAAAGIEGEWPDHYAQLLAAGFSNPYAAQADVQCSYCPDNTFQSETSSPRLLDHILLKNAPSEPSVARVLAETITLEPLDEDPVESNYSDHFGLQATLQPWCTE